MADKQRFLVPVSVFLIFLLVSSAVPRPAAGSFDIDVPSQAPHGVVQESGLISLQAAPFEDQSKRYLVFGPGPVSAISERTDKMIYGLESGQGSFAVGMFDQQAVASLRLDGYKVVEDMPLEFDSAPVSDPGEVSRVANILGASSVIANYNYSGSGIRIGIVDTGTDFSNIDVRYSVARDSSNAPVMIDADGQGLVLTNATFLAQISNTGVVQNYTHPIPKNATGSVYVSSDGVFLDLAKGGKGTTIQVYNSQYPKGGTAVINGTVSNDYKIGKDARHYIMSRSGVYHFGMVYQSVLQGQLSLLQLVPVLVVDSTTPGVYDTIIPDMSDSYKDFTRITNPLPQQYDYDFTNEPRIKIGGGNEYLVYSTGGDGQPIYSAGTVGARVVDVWGVFSHPAKIDKRLGAINGTLLAPLDPHGNYFGVMYDNEGHGTATAASIVSQAKARYDVYGNSTKYDIRGMAPGAKIVPIKALWLGDAIYGWLWAAGFDQQNSTWKYSGKPRVDIISNSWGISTFPALGSVPGLDVGSLLLSALNVPGSLDKNFPGVLTVSSSGNAGPGYGTIGSPDGAPFGLTVGAATDNVFVGYGPFKGQPRFGNTTQYWGDVSGFSSKGPTVIGDPKPDILAVGEYSFTPTSVTKYNKNSTGPFALFGGTSLAAPLTAGAAAIVMQALHDRGVPYNPFLIKNILMSTADDLGNDAFAQGAGLVNVTAAVDYAVGGDGSFIVYNNATYGNTREVLGPALAAMNSSSFGLGTFHIGNSSLPETPWFAGRLYPGERITADFTVANPSDRGIDVDIKAQKLELEKVSQYNGTTEPRLQDPSLKKAGVYRPDYLPLDRITNHTDLLSYFKKSDPIPHDASMMDLGLTFPFSEFLNASSAKYADEMRISSIYVYDWYRHNGTQPSYLDLSLVNRGGSWGTSQDVRISHPDSRFDHIPLVGVYPVPTKFSYWTGDTKMNATAMAYNLTASYYHKVPWAQVWLDSASVHVGPHSRSDVPVTLVVPSDSKPGIYQGFVSFTGANHTVNVPVSYVVLKKLQPKDLPTVVRGSSGGSLFGNGYVGGGFDMANRYNAGDWRQYYFDVRDKTINTATMIFSWENPATNLSVFVVDPRGNIIQTNSPPGVLGQFQGWPSGDWLGPSTPFSEGGGFYPVKNKDATSTEVYAPINQTGVYSVLVHTTLYGGESVAEPLTMFAKFSTILPSESPPAISMAVPGVVNGTYKMVPRITGDGIEEEKYSLDSQAPVAIGNGTFPNATMNLPDGQHTLVITATDAVGHEASKEFSFTVDNTPPSVAFQSPSNGVTVSGTIQVKLGVSDAHLPQKGWLEVRVGNVTVSDSPAFDLDTKTLANGPHEIRAIAKDLAGNSANQTVTVVVDNSAAAPGAAPVSGGAQVGMLAEVLAGVAAGAAASFFIFKRFRTPAKA
ncbi:MAG TPA: S8 family serine peptidase [Candidatus Nitrosotalea sp.]|nr:S8 family serine peptidase [Candidatus Nitrosotalea sp.]